MESMSVAEMREHLTDMNDGGDHGEKTAYFAWLSSWFLYGIWRWIGNDRLDDKVLDPWHRKPELPEPVELKPGDRDELKEALKARLAATKGMRFRSGNE